MIFVNILKFGAISYVYVYNVACEMGTFPIIGKTLSIAKIAVVMWTFASGYEDATCGSIPGINA